MILYLNVDLDKFRITVAIIIFLPKYNYYNVQVGKIHGTIKLTESNKYIIDMYFKIDTLIFVY